LYNAATHILLTVIVHHSWHYIIQVAIFSSTSCHSKHIPYSPLHNLFHYWLQFIATANCSRDD